MTLKKTAIAAILVAGIPGAALAVPPCVPGYAHYGGVCQPVHPPGYSNPASGAVQGEASGAARGQAAAGPVGAVVGGAVGIAAGTLRGTANMLSGGSTPPACGPGRVYDNGGCYVRR
jgi:hypothetical protein